MEESAIHIFFKCCLKQCCGLITSWNRVSPTITNPLECFGFQPWLRTSQNALVKCSSASMFKQVDSIVMRGSVRPEAVRKHSELSANWGETGSALVIRPQDCVSTAC